MNIGRTIDHIVYAVPNLKAACDEWEAKLGIRPTFGGHHKNQGTQNALLDLGAACYLEILAIDEANTAIRPPRWMGIDLITQPQITRWAIKSEDLAADSAVLRAYHPDMGRIHGGQRQTSNGSLLSWEMILPLAEPAVEVVPFMVDWRSSASHPCDALEAGCRLLGLKVGHPALAQIQAVWKGLELEVELEQAERPFVEMVIEGKRGIVSIS